MFLKFSCIILIVLMYSCGTNQNYSRDMETNSNSEIEAQKIIGKEMMAAGYLPGRVMYSELADDCEYTIQLKDGEKDFYYVDPINLAEAFRNDEQTVWIKFNALEMDDRCEKASPVELLEIMDRRE